jgi:hypothetical protein
MQRLAVITTDPPSAGWNGTLRPGSIHASGSRFAVSGRQGLAFLPDASSLFIKHQSSVKCDFFCWTW